MTQSQSVRTILLTAVAALVLPMSGHSQNPPVLPAKMHWCAVNCITLVLYHGHYVAENDPHPEQAINCGLFTVERFTRDSVVMHRTDCEPPGSAILTGKISSSGNAIVDGTITWTSHPCCGTGSRSFHAAWGSEIDSIPGGGVAPQSLDRPPAAAQTGATTSADALVARVNAALAASTPQPAQTDAAVAGQVQIENVPPLIDECEEVRSRKNCATWKWTGGDYIAIWGDGTAAHITVQQWNRGGVLLQRSDYGADRSSGTYQGHWLGDGSIAGEGSLQWSGGLLVNVPTNAGVVAEVKWTATSQRATSQPHAPCDVRNPPSATSVDISKMMSDARGAGDLVGATCWAYVGALQGNAMAQDTYGYELIIGLGVAKNPQAAYEWTKKAADQGDQNARQNLRRMYSIGFGVAPDAEKAGALGRDQLGRLLERLRTPSGFARSEYLLEAADGCEQDPESARAFADACAAVYQDANTFLREREQSHRDFSCREQATTPFPRGAYNPDGKKDQFSQATFDQCMNNFAAIRDRYP